MTTEAAIQTLTNEVRALRKEVRSLKKEREVKPLWVSAQVLKDHTNWDKHDMERARELNWVKHERVEGKTLSYRYDLNSIDQKFLKVKV
jgi:hypothetical protein